MKPGTIRYGLVVLVARRCLVGTVVGISMPPGRSIGKLQLQQYGNFFTSSSTKASSVVEVELKMRPGEAFTGGQCSSCSVRKHARPLESRYLCWSVFDRRAHEFCAYGYAARISMRHSLPAARCHHTCVATHVYQVQRRLGAPSACIVRKRTSEALRRHASMFMFTHPPAHERHSAHNTSSLPFSAKSRYHTTYDCMDG